MSKFFRLFPLLLLMSGIWFFPVTSVFANGEKEADKNDIIISISPKEGLFDISNMKPGDWAPRTLTVENIGNKDFDYHMQLENRGEDKLFNGLQLEIKAGDMELYQGKMAAFQSLSARELTSGTEENLDITIRFPEHLGNDFQGLASSFVFSFTAEGKDSTAVPAVITGQIGSGGLLSAGLNLPTTSTNIFNLLLFGTVFVIGGIVWLTIRHYRRMKIAQ